MTGMETKQIRAYLSDSEIRALNARAAEKGITRAWLVTMALATAPVTRDLFKASRAVAS